MRKIFALTIALLLCASSALAAEWAEGRSPARPYAGLAEVDLSEKMGYIVLWPSAKVPADHFCDTLTIYLPREDVALGAGKLTLMNAEGPVSQVDFADPAAVTLRPLDEEEMDALLWGSGVAIEVQLPVSLSLQGGEYVEMDEGCFTAADGKVRSAAIADRSGAWRPTVSGEWGLGCVRYDEDGTVRFEIALGGEAQTAVVYSGNGSVEVDEPEYTESAEVVARVVSDEVDWGVVFLDAAGEILGNYSLRK